MGGDGYNEALLHKPNVWPPAPPSPAPALMLLYLVLQTILVGDSGVGKTSLLVQFDQGKFIPGSFSATVGIGFTGCCSLPVLLTSLPAPILQVMLLGDSGVGKTCFLLQFKDGAFLSGTFIATVGIDFRNKVVVVDGVKVKLQIWDTAGQERFRSVTHAYYRDAQALLLLYDITSKMSFDNIRAWLTEIHEYAQKDVVIMLLGNKVSAGSSSTLGFADVSRERAVRTEDGASLARGKHSSHLYAKPGARQGGDDLQALSRPQGGFRGPGGHLGIATDGVMLLLQEYGVPFMETSAKTGMNVELAFLAIAKELKQRAVQPLDEPRFQIHEYIESQKKKSSCCAFS
ncbi:hypothetical protein Nmel_016284 [Mimus melanotis]